MEFVGAAIDKLDAFYKEHLGPVAWAVYSTQ
jgi:hypothetical protein